MKRTQLLSRIGITVGCLALLAFLLVGALQHWKWAGFDKPLYDWMQLLIIPVALAVVAVWFNRIDKKNELTIAQKRADDERALAIDNQQEAALQGYLDRMQELLLHEKLRASEPGDEVRNVARVRTLTMLYQLDSRRTTYMLAFLRESGLLTEDSTRSIVALNNALLSRVDLHDVDFNHVDLREADLSGADLRGANLGKANLNGADLSKANLSGADLFESDLGKANLSGADLSKANLGKTNFRGANLSGADLRGAFLFRTNLSGADLLGASLRKANLFGATLIRASLKETDLREASLREVDLFGSDLSGANLSEAEIDQPSLNKARMTNEQLAKLTIITR